MDGRTNGQTNEYTDQWMDSIMDGQSYPHIHVSHLKMIVFQQIFAIFTKAFWINGPPERPIDGPTDGHANLQRLDSCI